MGAVDVGDELLGEGGSVVGGTGRYEVGEFGKSADNNEYGGVGGVFGRRRTKGWW